MSKFRIQLLNLVREKPWLYKYLSDEVKEDRKITETALTACGDALEFAPDKFKSDRDLVLMAVETGDAFLHASEELQHDKEIILKALEWDSSIVEYLDEEFYEDLEIMYKAVEIDADNYEYLVEELQEDKEIALACLKLNCHVFEFLCDELKEDGEIIEIAIKNGLSLKYIVQGIKDFEDIVSDKELVATAIKHNDGDQLKFASDELKNDKELIDYAIEHKLSMLSNIGKESLKDKAILRKFFGNPHSLENSASTSKNIFAIPKEFLLDDDFMLELITDNEYIFQAMYSNIFQKIFKRNIPIKMDVVFCKKAYKVNPKTLKFMSNNMKKCVKS